MPLPTKNGPMSPAKGPELVADGVTPYLRELILSGQLKSGEPLRIEHLAEMLGVSNTPVRESLLELLADGFVTRSPRKGYVVAELTPEGFRDQVLVLAMITGELAARAATRITPDQLDGLVELQRQLDKLTNPRSREAAEDTNYRLHSAINKIAESPTLALIAQRTSHYVPRFTWQSLRSRPATCSYDHGVIIDALRDRNADGARTGMYEHLIASGEQAIRSLDEDGFWSAGA